MHDALTTQSEPPFPQHRLGHANERHGSHHGPGTMRRRGNAAAGEELLVKGLAWFSIGLGLAQLIAPRTLSKATGIQDRPLLMRALGVREIAAGIGILSRRQPSPWLWSRVAGDAMDLTMLGLAASQPGARRKRVAAATAAVAGVTALDVLSSVRHGRRGDLEAKAAGNSLFEFEKSIAVNRTADECYLFWRDFQGFPRFMKHLESVRMTGGNRSHWKARGPAGSSIEWDAELTVDQPGQLLAWHSMAGAQIENAGTASFERAPGGRGTIVRVQLRYNPPGSEAGALAAKLFGADPRRQIEEDLRRFKCLIETGEIPTTEGQPSGRRSAIARLLFRKGAPG